ncbi:hypothetical protein BT67DRAFT_24932 [Trichocladium antarcticum]|uniref:Uncharacterized protein n=1 Tax=Trichocladium antarcticum TaxID=1450529 RepID=A0AAN6ZHQ2_9PEZI|nr:hypothetical protein BT67DRAFT_24932 [Trichocladium antarcticum]
MSAAVCTIAGNASVYGLGIRLSFYLLWFAVLIGERFREHHAKVLRGAELVLAYAVFLGLAMTTSSGHLFAAEVYVALLLISTTVYLLVPRHTSDLVAWIRPDLGLGAQHAGFGIVAAARCLFVLIVVGLQMWFWGTGVESAAIDRVLRAQGGGCQPPQQFGFGFGPVDLRLGGFRALNVLLMLALLAGGVVVGAMKAGVVGTKKSRRRRRSTRRRTSILREVETFGGLAVACVLIAVIELSIRWNGIPTTASHQASTPAQLIPLLLIIGLILTFLYDLMNSAGDEGSSSSTTATTTATTDSGSSHGNGGGGKSSSSGTSSSDRSSPPRRGLRPTPVFTPPPRSAPPLPPGPPAAEPTTAAAAGGPPPGEAPPPAQPIIVEPAQPIIVDVSPNRRPRPSRPRPYGKLPKRTPG